MTRNERAAYITLAIVLAGAVVCAPPASQHDAMIVVVVGGAWAALVYAMAVRNGAP